MLAGGYPLKLRLRATHWGYDPSPNSPHITVPDKGALDILNRGIDLLEHSSLKAVADWITQKTGRRMYFVRLMEYRDRRNRQREQFASTPLYTGETKKKPSVKRAEASAKEEASALCSTG